jgi:hypothetical protein
MPPRSSNPQLTSRAAGTLALAALASALGALILGEYDFSGLTPYVTALLFALVLGELVAEVGRLRSWVVAGASAALVALALGWAAWINSGSGLRPFPRAAWGAMVVGVVVVTWRTGPRRPSRARSSTSHAPPTAD